MNLSVLRTYRAQLEDTLRVELAELQQMVEQEQVAHQRLLCDAEDGAADFLRLAKTGMTIDEAHAQQAKLDSLANSIRRAQETVATARQRCEQKLAEVMDAARERKKLEILQRRETVKQTKQEKRSEQADLDHAAGLRFLAAESRHEGC